MPDKCQYVNGHSDYLLLVKGLKSNWKDLDLLSLTIYQSY